MNDSLTNFREASIEDIPQIIEIMNRGYHQNWDSNYYKNLISDGNSFTYVLTLNAVIVGFITGKKSRDICDIYMIIVDIKYRRQGFANLLLSKTITALSDLKITEFFLEVAETNNQAINLYQKTGFTAVNRRIGYYKISNENVDAIVYRLVNNNSSAVITTNDNLYTNSSGTSALSSGKWGITSSALSTVCFVATVGSGGLVTGVFDCSCGGGGGDDFPPP